MLALAKIAIQPNVHPLSHLITPDTREKMTNNAWPVFASFTWAFVMYIFRWYPDTLASSLRSSMKYMYVPFIFFFFAFRYTLLTNITSYADSDHWDSFRNLLVHNK